MNVRPFIAALLAVLFSSHALFAQSPLPFDSTIVRGELKNGLRYFIKENPKPEGRVELRLVIKAGSILETEEQRGLAHFLEHMAFNGTRDYEKNELVSFLQSAGVEFGADLNAYTSFDETVYILPLPADSLELVVKGFEILQNWAAHISFEEAEIDKERGVVIEEWRIGRGAEQRMFNEYLPKLYYGSRYADRLPIGNRENLESFDPKVLKQFYNDWYRPNLMAVVAVGDIDADWTKTQIETKFGKLKNPRKRKQKERAYFGTEAHDSTLISIVSDAEAAFTTVALYYKHKAYALNTEEDFMERLHHEAFNGMMDARLFERSQEPDPPFIFASSAHVGSFSPKTDMYQSIAYVSENGVERGLATLVEENERVSRHGFLPSELERFKKNLRQSYETAFNERDKTESARFASELVSHFLSGEAVPGIAFEYDFIQKNIEHLSLERINDLASDWIGYTNRVVVITGPEKDGVEYPEESRVMEIINGVETENIAPYTDAMSNSNIAPKIVSPGSIIQLDSFPEVDVARWTLSNGVVVYGKKTDFKNDQVLLRGYSTGGTSVYEDSLYLEATLASGYVGSAGFAAFSSVDLNKILAGNSASISVSIGEVEESVRGSSAPKDLETMFQMLYQQLTAPRRSEDDFSSFISQNKSILQNLNANPNFYFGQQVQRVVNSNHPRRQGFPTKDELEQVDLDDLMFVFRDRFSDLDDLVLVIVGNFEPESLKPLLETYVATLPATDREESWVDRNIEFPNTSIDTTFYKGKEPQSQVRMIWHNAADFTQENQLYSSFLSSLLDIKLIEEVREKMSGVYGIGASAELERIPEGRFSLSVGFPCAPNRVDEISAAVEEVILQLREEGPSVEDLNKVKETFRQQTKIGLQQNSFWASTLVRYHKEKLPLERILEWESRIQGVSSSDIQGFLNTIFNPDSRIRIVLKPEQ